MEAEKERKEKERLQEEAAAGKEFNEDEIQDDPFDNDDVIKLDQINTVRSSLFCSMV
jgi:hypothetical protein